MSLYHITNEAETVECAQKLADTITAPCFITLSGDLGAGKSVFARAMIQKLTDAPDQEVPSPTFTLVQHYETDKGSIYHFDLYRLEEERDVIELGWDDAVFEGICLVEWAERANGLLPENRIDIKFIITGENTRDLIVTAQGDTRQYEL